jgi:hypothetical protein
VQVAVFNNARRATALAETATRAVHGRGNPDGEHWLTLFASVAQCLVGDWQLGLGLVEEIVDAPEADHFTKSFAVLGLAVAQHVLGRDDEARRRITALIDALPPVPARHLDTIARALLAVVETSRGAGPAGRAALASTTELVRRRYQHIPSAWGIPVIAAGAMSALEGRDTEAVEILVGAGAQGRFWPARAEPTYLIHQWYARRLAERMPPDDFAAAWAAGEQLTTEDLIETVDRMAASHGS